MAQRKPFCPNCGQIFSDDTRKCPHCGRTSHKTVAEAYGSWSGNGLFDLIPGIRDLPDQTRRALMICVVSVIVGLVILVPTILNLVAAVNR